MEFDVIDAHVHCGKGYSFKEYHKEIKETPIKSAVVFSLSDDIYPKGKKYFRDNNEWKEKRKLVNKSILSLADSSKEIKVYPFKFLWNDFNMEDLKRYFGVKWHRRGVDPEYEMGSPKFSKLIDRLREMNMPIIFEDEFDNTMKFLDRWSEGLNVIIPHLGYGSRNYEKLEDEDVWDMKNVYTDTSYASDVSGEIIKKHASDHGGERIFFGSDYPLSNPKEEIEKILSLRISYRSKKAIAKDNMLRLLNNVRH